MEFLQTTNSRRNQGTFGTRFRHDPEKLAAEIAEMTGETKTGAVRQALREKKKRLEMGSGNKEERRQKLRKFLETEIWSQIPDELLGREPMSKEEWKTSSALDRGDIDDPRQFGSYRSAVPREGARTAGRADRRVRSLWQGAASRRSSPG
ncbi:MAG: type II toxin-antitoxin system VapB family antitoxin [Solirubrobacterales bacterium]